MQEKNLSSQETEIFESRYFWWGKIIAFVKNILNVQTDLVLLCKIILNSFIAKS